MLKRILSFVICAAVSLSVCGCGDDAGSGSRLSDSSSAASAAGTEAGSAAESLSGSEAESKAESEPDTQPAEGSSSLFIYLCGSDLETGQGIATKAIKELLTADVPEDMNIILQTGGTQKWRAYDISSDVSQRYEVRGGELKLIESLDENKNMGDPETLRDFASWCDTNYRSERNMMILWDHGAGSVRGVCFDETHGYDPLTLTELGEALKSADLKDKYDILGFDACLMATFETAVTVRDHADYMIASQDIEPSCGWGLKTVAETFSKEPDAAKTGKVICDDFVKRCKEKNKNDYLSTLSVFDLSKTDKLIEAFNAMLSIPADSKTVKEKNYLNIVSAIRECEHFGGDTLEDGYSNMLDMVDFILCADVINDITIDLIGAISNEFVVYFADCEARNNFGISFYFPTIYDEKEIDDYLDLGINETYNNMLKKLYTNIPKTTIEFADSGSVAEDGAFTVQLTPESNKYLTSIDYIMMITDENGDELAVAADNDLYKNWDDMSFKSNFRGITLALDGHRIFYKTINSTNKYITFSAPLYVNGTLRNYRFSFIRNSEEFNGGHYQAGGLWGGYDENGLPQTGYEDLKKGDKIQVISGVKMEDGKLKMIPGEEFVIGEEAEEISEIPLAGKEYHYYFVATDIFNGQIASKLATFEMTKTYEELLKDPLPDGTYAAKVVDIREYKMPE